jgi:hypothetical protein
MSSGLVPVSRRLSVTDSALYVSYRFVNNCMLANGCMTFSGYAAVPFLRVFSILRMSILKKGK